MPTETPRRKHSREGKTLQKIMFLSTDQTAMLLNHWGKNAVAGGKNKKGKNMSKLQED